jgi:hypothetical protein
MGATYIAETAHGPTVEVAYQQMIAALTSRHEDWDDPVEKGGDIRWIQVWPDPVPDCAIEWMRGWVEQNPPAVLVEAAEADTHARSARYGWRVKPEPFDKFGPWLVFPLASARWHFFGWVNT